MTAFTQTSPGVSGPDISIFGPRQGFLRSGGANSSGRTTADQWVNNLASTISNEAVSITPSMVAHALALTSPQNNWDRNKVVVKTLLTGLSVAMTQRASDPNFRITLTPEQQREAFLLDHTLDGKAQIVAPKPGVDPEALRVFLAAPIDIATASSEYVAFIGKYLPGLDGKPVGGGYMTAAMSKVVDMVRAGE